MNTNMYTREDLIRMMNAYDTYQEGQRYKEGSIENEYVKKVESWMND